jgi:dTDP-4-dehydrorhamnose 3,5-epimerase
MNYIETSLPDVWIIEPVVFKDARGYFMEVFKQAEFEQHIGTVHFMQENESCSAKGVLRGLHYQLAPFAQAKLVRVIQGTVLDVAVDIRRGSPTFGQYVAVELSAENKRQIFIPSGFAHGFYVVSDEVIFTYMVDNPYNHACERGIQYNDPAIGINWKIGKDDTLILSDKDQKQPSLQNAEINFSYTNKQ